MQKRVVIKNCTKENVNFIVDSIKEICRIEKEYCQPTPKLKKELIDAIKKKNVVGAFVEKKLVGYIWFLFSKKVPYGVNYGVEKPPYCWVAWSYVEKNTVGKELQLNYTKKWSKLAKHAE